MASDTGAAKAKEILKDSSSLGQHDNRENSSTTARDNSSSAQKEAANSARTNASPITTQRDVVTAQTAKTNFSTPATNTYPSQSRDNSTTGSALRNSSTDPGRDVSQISSSSVNVPVNAEDRRLHSNFNNKVANRAYELYEQNGANHGDDLFHWLQAESEMLTRIPEIQQTDSTYSVVTALGDFNAEDVSVTVEPNRALILADKQQSKEEGSDRSLDGVLPSRHSAFFVTDWPDPVDPSTATAQMKQGNLVLTVKRARATSNSEELKNSEIGR